MKRKCPKCGSIEESKFCTKCGQDLSEAAIVRTCPNCGAETTSRFCIQCGTKVDQEDPIKGQTEKTSAVENKNNTISAQEAKQKEEEEKQRIAKQKEEEEKQRIAKQKEEEEKQRIAKQKEEEEKQRIAKEKEEERLRKEKIQNNLRDKKKYEEALSYMEHAEQSNDKEIAAGFFRKAESMFDELLGWEDSEEKSLICARKAKACEIAVESKRIAEKSKSGEAKIEDISTSNRSKDQNNADKAKVSVEKKPSDGNKRTKSVIVAVLIGALVIGGVVFAMTQGKDSSKQAENTTDDSSPAESGEVFQGDLIAIEDGPTIEWDTGSAVLTSYQIEKSEYDGDCVNLYFDYSKTGGEDDSFSSALDVGVFQNGYELDEKTSTTTDAENKAFDQVKQGASLTAARGYMLNDSSELTVVLTAYDKDYNPIVERTEITIPDDKGKDISGNNKYFEETGETAIKDGISIKSKTGEVKLTGYKWTEYEGDEMLVLYFDFTNFTDDEQAMSGSDFNVTVFQNGVEQDNSGWSTSEAESHFFSQVQKDTTMHCGYSYSIPEKTEIEVKITCWTDGNEKAEEQVVSIK